MQSYRSHFFLALLGKCLKLNDEFTCLTACPNLNTKKMLGQSVGGWSKIMHYRSIPCLNTLLGSVRYLNYFAEVQPASLHC